MSPEGYSHAERKIFFYSAHLLIHTNLLKKKSKSIPTTVLKFWVGTRFVTTTTPTTPTTTTTTSNVDWKQFTQEVEDNIEKVTGSMSMKEKVDTFNSVLIEAGKKHVGKTKVGGRRKACITPPVRAAIRR